MQKLGVKGWTAVGAGLVVVAALFFGGTIKDLVFPNESLDKNQAAVGSITDTSGKPIANISTTAGVEIYDKEIGTGDEAVPGKLVAVHYVGLLADGTKFDSSIDRNKPFVFPLGGGQVIKGWELGIVGMKIGGVRRIVVSPEFGYGTNAFGPIPANSTLTFEVQLIGVK